MLSRRALLIYLPAATLAGSYAIRAFAADKTITIGINLPLTGADAHDAELIKDGALLAIDEANAKGGVAGYKINVTVLDDGTATAGQYDPAQAATNARKMVSDTSVVAAIGPQMSGSGKAIYFRTVTTDAFQGPNMANYFFETLKVKSLYVLDDSGAYGVGIADAFQRQAEKRGIKVLGRDQLNPKEADYTTVLTKIKSLNPDALYYGGVAQAGVKVVKQSYDIMPKIIRAGGDGCYGAEILKGAGFPAAEGLYATIAAPNLLDNPDAKPFVDAFVKKYSQQPENYSITAYDAALVIIDAVKRVAEGGKEVNRANVRDAIQTSKTKTLQGVVSFDENGDITNREVSVFQIHRDDSHPLDSVLHQYKYLGVAPQSS